MKESSRGLNRQVEALEKVARFVDSIGDLRKLLAEIMRVSEEMLEAEASSFLLYDPEKKELYFEIALGAKGGRIRKKRVKLGQGIAGNCAASGKTINIRDVYRDRRFFSGMDARSGFRTTSILAVPVRHKDKLLGVLEILNKRGGRPFNNQDQALAEIIASQAAVVVENAQLYAQSLKSERMSAIGQTIAGLSHDIKNILAGLQGGVELVDQSLVDEDVDTLQTGWRMVKKNIGKVSDLVLDMLNYARERGPSLRPTNINQVLTEAAGLYAEKLADQKAACRLALDDRIGTALLDPAGMERAILNLLNNALDALPAEGGLITLASRRSGRKLDIDIGDNGCGIPADKISEIFNMFFTTKGSHGTGLGLAVVDKIIREHKGRIRIKSRVGAGTTFTLTLPYREPDDEAEKRG
ncbi:MAG TPA: ATP-binding protein [bacterium]|nr:ATP-binding protein [bacterium]HNS49416.1 ATP-binding protein [bacterium]